MAKFKYVGIEGVETPATIYHYGTRFDRGEVSEITDETHAKKITAQEGFEPAPDDAETLADKQVKEAREANEKAREEDKKKREEAASGQKYRPVDDDDGDDAGIKDQKKLGKKDRIHAKSGYTSGNLLGKDDAKPGATSDNQPVDPNKKSKIAELGPGDDWNEGEK